MSNPNNLLNNAPSAQPTKQHSLKSLLAEPQIKVRFEEMLGKRAPSFLSSIVSAVSANKMLGECDPMSVIQSAAVAAAMDLPINASLGFAHIVPYNSKDGNIAQFQMGWKGFVQLAMRSGQYKTLNATPVLDGQIVSYNMFTGDMEFQEKSKSDDIVGYLLYFRLLNGYEKYFYMTHEKVLRHGKKYSKSFQKGKGLWIEDFDSMALKTVVKLGLSKYGLLTVEIQKALEFDQAAIDEKGEPVYVDSETRNAEPEEKPAAQSPMPEPEKKKASPVQPKKASMEVLK